MADAAASVARHFDGRIVYVNVMKNLSVDCDCVMHPEKPCMHDIGILSSLDPVAIDQACMDLVIGSDDPGRDRFMERVNSRNGIHTIEAAADLGIGSREYELVELRANTNIRRIIHRNLYVFIRNRPGAGTRCSRPVCAP